MSLESHYHRCEHCGFTFSHVASEIPRGQFAAAHRCPGCSLAVESLPCEFYPLFTPVDLCDWLGDVSSLKPDGGV